jgi:hypothetical protein
MDGLLVRELSWASHESPPHWDGKGKIGRTVRTGMYMYVFKVSDPVTGGIIHTRYGKMMAWYMD